MPFSVIVPTRDRPVDLARCLESLCKLEYPRDQYEVIVVDDGGTTVVQDIVAAVAKRVDVTIVTTAHNGPATARNEGIKHSRFDYLAFIDDDCAAHPSWLDVLARHLGANPRSPAGGRVINALKSNRYSRASQGLQDFLYRWYHEQRKGNLAFFTTNNLGVSREAFQDVGAFDPTFPFASEDRDWCDRATLTGRELNYVPDAIVYHWHDLNFSRFIQQHFRYGRGAVRFHSRRAARRGTRIRLEDPGFYREMFTAPFVEGRAAPVWETLLLLASQTASFAGFVAELATPSSPSQRLSTSARQP